MSWTQPGYEAIALLVSQRTGMALDRRVASVELGISRAMERAGTKESAEYLQLLTRSDHHLDDLIQEVAVGETYFFREPRQFDFIGREVLPEIRRRRGEDHQVRIWSAGCASGEEAYSLAILCLQQLQPEDFHILGTDICREALVKARRGVYTEWSLRGEGTRLVKPFITKTGRLYKLHDSIRKQVTFEHLNLAFDYYPSPVNGTQGNDLILCRNVMIYFPPDVASEVAHRLYESLADGGWLITASSDPPLNELAPFEVHMAEEGVFYRRLPLSTSSARHAKKPARWLSPEPVEMGAHSNGQLVLPAKTGREVGVKVPDLAVAEPEADMVQAAAAFQRGDYAGAVRLTRDLRAEVAAALLHVRAQANLDLAAAEKACAGLIKEHPLSGELHFVHAMLLWQRGRNAEALRAIRRLLFLDRSLAFGHFTFGSMLQQRGDLAGARRAFRNAQALCVRHDAEAPVPLAEDEKYGNLGEAAAARLATLQT